jgi:hypothetical protein
MNGTSGTQGAEREGGERGNRGADRRAEIVRVQAEVLARMRFERRTQIGRQRFRNAAGDVERHAAPVVNPRQRVDLLLRARDQAFALALDLLLEELTLRAHRNVFARAHRKRAGEEPRGAGDEDGARLGDRAGHAHDQAGIRHQAIADAEHRGAQVAARRERSCRLVVRAQRALFSVLNSEGSMRPSPLRSTAAQFSLRARSPESSSRLR